MSPNKGFTLRGRLQQFEALILDQVSTKRRFLVIYKYTGSLQVHSDGGAKHWGPVLTNRKLAIHLALFSSFNEFTDVGVPLQAAEKASSGSVLP